MVKSPKPRPSQPPKPARPPKRQRSPKKPKRAFKSSLPPLQLPRVRGQTPKNDEAEDRTARCGAESAAIARMLRALADELDPPQAVEGK